MSTSGSVDFNLTARELCTFALRKIRITGIGDTPSGEDISAAKDELNMMLKSLQLKAPNLWRQTLGSVTLVASTSTYTLSPRPFRVVEARYRSAGAIDLPMEELTRQEYLDMPNKVSTGVPTQYYVDHQRAASTLYVWPVPASVTIETVRYTYQRVFEDIDDLANDIDVPQEHLEAVGYQLAVRLAVTFGKDVPGLVEMAGMLMADVAAADREEIVRFVPAYR